MKTDFPPSTDSGRRLKSSVQGVQESDLDRLFNGHIGKDHYTLVKIMMAHRMMRWADRPVLARNKQDGLE